MDSSSLWWWKTWKTLGSLNVCPLYQLSTSFTCIWWKWWHSISQLFPYFWYWSVSSMMIIVIKFFCRSDWFDSFFLIWFEMLFHEFSSIKMDRIWNKRISAFCTLVTLCECCKQQNFLFWWLSRNRTLSQWSSHFHYWLVSLDLQRNFCFVRNEVNLIFCYFREWECCIKCTQSFFQICISEFFQRNQNKWWWRKRNTLRDLASLWL